MSGDPPALPETWRVLLVVRASWCGLLEQDQLAAGLVPLTDALALDAQEQALDHRDDVLAELGQLPLAGDRSLVVTELAVAVEDVTDAEVHHVSLR